MWGEAGDIDILADAASVAAGRVVSRHPAGTRLWEQGDETRYVSLLLSGRCRLVAKTAWGDYSVVELPGPCLVGMSDLLSGRPRLASLEVVEEGESALLGEDEVRVLLAAETPAAAAFRRVAILSSTHALRLVDESLGGFFHGSDEPERPPGTRGSGTYRAVVAGRPADAGRVRELFERSGLGAPLLSQLGLVERTYPAGARLTRTGEAATEAYLTYAGRVRISIKIPGVGEEALSILGPGEIVGEMGLADGSLRSAYAIAHDGPVTVFVLARPVFLRLLTGKVEGAAPLVARIASSLAHRFEETAARAIAFHVLSGGSGSSPPDGFEFDEDVDPLLPDS